MAHREGEFEHYASNNRRGNLILLFIVSKAIGECTFSLALKSSHWLSNSRTEIIPVSSLLCGLQRGSFSAIGYMVNVDIDQYRDKNKSWP